MKPVKMTNKEQSAASSSTRSKDITTNLLRRIIDGIYPAGSLLPTERQLAEEFGVARTIIREALKRIEAMNLITIRQGSGALTADIQKVGGIEIADLLMYRSDGSIDSQFLKDVGQLHEGMHIWLARLTAQRITPEEIDTLRKLLMERAAMSKDDERLPDITLKISRNIVQASHNRYIQLLFNTLARTTRASRTVFEMPFYFDPEVQSFFERLIEAFENRDSEMAMLLVSRVFESNRENYMRAIDRLSQESKSENLGTQDDFK
jgi:DNA-binding FadR family transcriptional regulator